MIAKHGRAVVKWIYRLTNVALRNPSAITGHYKYLFIMSHMRGYTSLLSHILGSHPEISGYFELHQSYCRPLDLFLMRVRIANGLNYRVQGSYLLDKVLHSKWSLSHIILQRQDVFTLFMMRKPEDSLRSLMDMRQKRGFPADVLAYYVDRLHCLKNMSYLPGNRAYLDGESLLDDPQTVLEFVRSYLKLNENISPSYSMFKFTGQGGFGDRSEFIKEGKIVRERKAHSEFQVAPETLEKAYEAYYGARHILKQNCLSI